MSEVIKRTVYYDMSDGYMRFHDWATVTVAEFGSMVEPFTVLSLGVGRNMTDRPNVDNVDSMRLITEMQQASLDKHYINLSYGGESNLHGGFQYPRTGR
jgi:hypothetical protein